MCASTHSTGRSMKRQRQKTAACPTITSAVSVSVSHSERLFWTQLQRWAKCWPNATGGVDNDWFLDSSCACWPAKRGATATTTRSSSSLAAESSLLAATVTKERKKSRRSRAKKNELSRRKGHSEYTCCCRGNRKDAMMLSKFWLLLMWGPLLANAQSFVATLMQCKLFMAVADTNRDNRLDADSEYSAWLNRMTASTTYSATTYAALPESLRNLYESHATASSGQIDISGAKPGTLPADPAQGSNLDDMCQAAPAALEAASTSISTSTSASSTNTSMPSAVATAEPAGGQQPATVNSGSASPALTTPKPVPASAIPSPASGDPPATQPRICTISLAVADTDRNNLLSETEYIAFLNRIAANRFDSITSFASLPQSLQINYNTLVAASGNTPGEGLPITGASPSQQADAIQQALLDRTCADTDTAIFNAATSTPIAPPTAAPLPSSGTPSTTQPEITLLPSGVASAPPSDTSTGFPRTDIAICKIAMAVADEDRNSLLSATEYIVFVNRIARNKWPDAATILELSSELQDNFNSLAAGNNIDIYGASPAQQASEAQTLALSKICESVDLAIYTATTGSVSGVGIETETPVVTEVPSTGNTTGNMTLPNYTAPTNFPSLLASISNASMTPTFLSNIDGYPSATNETVNGTGNATASLMPSHVSIGTPGAPTHVIESQVLSIHSSFRFSTTTGLTSKHLNSSTSPTWRAIELSYQQFVRTVVPRLLAGNASGLTTSLVNGSTSNNQTTSPATILFDSGITSSATNTSLRPVVVTNDVLVTNNSGSNAALVLNTSRSLPSSKNSFAAKISSLFSQTASKPTMKILETSKAAISPPSARNLARATIAFDTTSAPTPKRSALSLLATKPDMAAVLLPRTATFQPSSSGATAIEPSMHDIAMVMSLMPSLGASDPLLPNSATQVHSISGKVETLSPNLRGGRQAQEVSTNTSQSLPDAGIGVPINQLSEANIVPAPAPNGTTPTGSVLSMPEPLDANSSSTTSTSPGSSNENTTMVTSPETNTTDLALSDAPTPAPSFLGSSAPIIKPVASGTTTTTPVMSEALTATPDQPFNSSTDEYSIPEEDSLVGVSLNEGARLLRFEDVVCGEGTAIENCLVAFAVYSVSVSDDVDRESVYNTLVARTQEAIENGLLQEALDLFDSTSNITIEGASFPPYVAIDSPSPTPTPGSSSDVASDEDAILGLSLGAFIAIVSALVGMACLACGFFVYVILNIKSGGDPTKDIGKKGEPDARDDFEDEPAVEPSLKSLVEDKFGFHTQPKNNGVFFGNEGGESLLSDEENKPPGDNKAIFGYEIGGPDEFTVEIEEGESEESSCVSPERIDGAVGGFPNEDNTISDSNSFGNNFSSNPDSFFSGKDSGGWDQSLGSPSSPDDASFDFQTKELSYASESGGSNSQAEDSFEESESGDDSYDSEREMYRERIEDLVKVAAPHELGNIDMMMQQFQGREEELVQTLQTMHAKKLEGGDSEGSGSDYDDEIENQDDESQYEGSEYGDASRSEDYSIEGGDEQSQSQDSADYSAENASFDQEAMYSEDELSRSEEEEEMSNSYYSDSESDFDYA